MRVPMKPCLVLILCALCWMDCAASAMKSEKQTEAPSRPKRVLFIGNSFTYWHGGLWTHLNSLSHAMDPPLAFETAHVVKGGASLEVLWRDTDAASVIARGGWDFVVLQDDIPETSLASFRTYARRFVDAVRKAGACPLLFMAWEYDRLDWIDMHGIAKAHRSASLELDVDVAPVGMAWSRSRSTYPEVTMYAPDREHPSPAGMYLSLIVIEGILSGADPRTRDVPVASLRGLEQLTTDTLQGLRQVASETILNWSKTLERTDGGKP
jgi:hypothetical protein